MESLDHGVVHGGLVRVNHHLTFLIFIVAEGSLGGLFLPDRLSGHHGGLARALVERALRVSRSACSHLVVFVRLGDVLRALVRAQQLLLHELSFLRRGRYHLLTAPQILQVPAALT